MAVSKETRIYIQDHLAGAAGGLELARRAARQNRGTRYGPALEQLAEEIAQDREILVAIADELGVGRDRVKELGGWAAEKAGRLKLNGRLVGYSPLSRLLELEALMLGVSAKAGLWRALRQSVGERVAGHMLGDLAKRALKQRDRLERLRLAAAEEALGAPREEPTSSVLPAP
jgi:hypothetical protein